MKWRILRLTGVYLTAYCWIVSSVNELKGVFVVQKARNQDFQKRYNRALVLDTIRRSPQGISRVALASSLALKKSSITNITGELIEQGVVIEAGQSLSPQKAGRKPVPLQLNGSFRHFLGVELHPSMYRASVTDLNGRQVYRTRGAIVTPERGSDAGHFARMTRSVVHTALEEVARMGIEVAGIGIGIPGYIDSRNGYIIYSEPHNVRGFSFIEEVAVDFGVPVILENDANCGAWGEVGHPFGSDVDNFLFALGEFQDSSYAPGQPPGLSLGFGLVINGRVYSGSSNSAGEFKSSRWRRGNHSQVSIPDERIARIHEDSEVFDEYLREVLSDISMLASVLDPERIVIGGDLSDRFERIRELLAGPMADSYLSEWPIHSFFTKARYGHDAVAAGAAAMVVEDLFGGLIRHDGNRCSDLKWETLLDMPRSVLGREQNKTQELSVSDGQKE